MASYCIGKASAWANCTRNSGNSGNQLSECFPSLRRNIERIYICDPPSTGCVERLCSHALLRTCLFYSAHPFVQDQPPCHACRVCSLSSIARASNNNDSSMNVAAGPKLAAAVTNAGKCCFSRSKVHVTYRVLQVVLASLVVFARAPSFSKDPLTTSKHTWKTKMLLSALIS